jgi:hypothetical protein
MDFEYGTDVKSGNQRYWNFYRREDREERALFQAMATDKTKSAGSENNVNLTNLWGSSILTSNYRSYHCATAPKDVAQCCPDPAHGDCDQGYQIWNGPYLRTVANGYSHEFADNSPALAPYPGVWGQTVLSQGRSPIKITERDPLIQGARVFIPSFLDPYSACATNDTSCDPNDPKYATPINVLVPWLPAVPGVGFSYPINGTQDQQITTESLDFSGVLETIQVDFKDYVDNLKPDCTKDSDCKAGSLAKPSAARTTIRSTS